MRSFSACSCTNLAAKTPSATCPPIVARASCMVRPRPSSSPTRRLREWLEVAVAMRSRRPLRPVKVSLRAPCATPKLNAEMKKDRDKLDYQNKKYVIAYMRAWADLLTEEGAMDVAEPAEVQHT